VLERQLTKLIRASLRHAGMERSILWGVIGVLAYAMRRSLRDADDKPTTVRVKRGHDVTIAVRDQDG
jgi:hypothetical protein